MCNNFTITWGYFKITIEFLFSAIPFYGRLDFEYSDCRL